MHSNCYTAHLFCPTFLDTFTLILNPTLFALAAGQWLVYRAASMQIEFPSENEASLGEVGFAIEHRQIRPTIRTVMQTFALGQRRASELLHELVEEGLLVQDNDTKRFRLKPDDHAIERTSVEIKELTRLTLERFAERARNRELS